MTAPLRGSQRFSAIPASQNSAPVHEFRALFTHDIRRKQKRWQDGYLKFHTFNNRVMVYDQSRNFLGDTYYKESDELHEGDELTLDKGIMVEVAEAMGVTQTDLTPLFEKKKESPQRPNTAAVPKPNARPTIPPSNALRAASQLRHKSLNALLGTPRGPVGKAVPMQSPYEARKEKENQCAEERASKRQKTTHEPVNTWNSRPMDDRESVMAKTLPSWAKTSGAKTPRTPKRPLPKGATVISLDSETDNIFSDVTLPSTPPGTTKSTSRSMVTPVPKSAQVMSIPPPAYATPKLPKGKVPVPSVKARETPQPAPQPSSPPISASNRLSNVDFAIQAVQQPRKEPAPVQSPPRKPKAKSLRLSKGVKRGMLLCQSVQRGETPLEQRRVSRPAGTTERRHLPLLRDNDHDNDQPLQQTILSKSGKSTEHKQNPVADSAFVSKSARSAENEASPQPSPDFFDDMELIHGLMDQQLVVASSPSEPREPATRKSQAPPGVPDPKPAAATKTPSKRKGAHDRPPIEDVVPKGKKAKIATTKEAGKKARGKKKQADKIPAISTIELADGHPKDASIPALETPESLSRNTSVSISPKKVALSTGGFRKRVKQAQHSLSKTNAAEIQPVSVALPPHPLRASKSGPLMTTTELSALLQKSHNAAKRDDDPIEDGTQKAKSVSPNESFQRSRSENDAPIPSTSDEWEKRNLGKSSESIIEAATVDQSVEELAGIQRPKAGGLAALVKKTDPRRRFQRTQSLNVDTNVPSVEEPDTVTPPPDDDVGPWSTEAFDLFDWRPPHMEGVDRGIGLLVNNV